MKLKPIATSLTALVAFTTVGTLPAAAQPAGYGYNERGGSSDRDAFWRGAPADPYQRIDFLQHRIDRGAADGSLDRGEARQSQGELNLIRRDADRMRARRGGRLRPADYGAIQSRLDQLSQRLHWSRRDGAGSYGAPVGNGYASDRNRTDYDASRYYRDGSGYSERRLADNDEVYRGSDGRYYCKRSDGTTGLIVGGAAGGILGNLIDGGHNRAAGTLIGGALGALAGRSVAQSNDIRCR